MQRPNGELAFLEGSFKEMGSTGSSALLNCWPILIELGLSRAPDSVPPVVGRDDAGRHRLVEEDQGILFRQRRNNFPRQSRNLQTSGENLNPGA